MKKPDSFISELDKLLFISPQVYLDPYRVREDAIALFNYPAYLTVIPKRTQKSIFNFSFLVSHYSKAEYCHTFGLF
jgi:hypothetical protein